MLGESAKTHLVQHIDESLVFLSEDFGEVDGTVDTFRPGFRFECELGSAFRYGRQLEEIAGNDQLGVKL